LLDFIDKLIQKLNTPQPRLLGKLEITIYIFTALLFYILALIFKHHLSIDRIVTTELSDEETRLIWFIGRIWWLLLLTGLTLSIIAWRANQKFPQSTIYYLAIIILVAFGVGMLGHGILEFI